MKLVDDFFKELDNDLELKEIQKKEKQQDEFGYVLDKIIKYYNHIYYDPQFDPRIREHVVDQFLQFCKSRGYNISEYENTCHCGYIIRLKIAHRVIDPFDNEYRRHSSYSSNTYIYYRDPMDMRKYTSLNFLCPICGFRRSMACDSDDCKIIEISCKMRIENYES